MFGAMRSIRVLVESRSDRNRTVKSFTLCDNEGAANDNDHSLWLFSRMGYFCQISELVALLALASIEVHLVRIDVKSAVL